MFLYAIGLLGRRIRYHSMAGLCRQDDVMASTVEKIASTWVYDEMVSALMCYSRTAIVVIGAQRTL